MIKPFDFMERLERCFACNKPLAKAKAGCLVDTRDGQTALVGPDCFKRVQRSGDAGYQPPLGGPRLYPLADPALPQPYDGIGAVTRQDRDMESEEHYVERIAKVCHEANRAYCAGIGDKTQLPWEQAPQWQKDSAINGVRFANENPDAPPSASHENWLRQKEADGWKYGPIKNEATKEHPCFVPYADLPHEQRIKDALFLGVVRAFS